MKQFRVNEYGEHVWIQQWNEELKTWNFIEKSEKYDGYVDYFQSILKVISSIIENFDLVLNVTEEVTLMILNLEDEELSFAEEIKSKLLKEFPDDIEQIGIVGNAIFFFEYNS